MPTDLFHRVKVSRVISSDRGVFLTLTDQYGEDKFLEIETYEGALVAFYWTKISARAHIKTIHDLFITFVLSSNYKINRVLVEKADDGIGYASVLLVKHGKATSFRCGLADGVIIAMATECDFFVDPSTWVNMEDYDLESGGSTKDISG